LINAYQAWLDERASWRSVIYLNLVRSVNDILDVLVQQMAHQNILTSPSGSATTHPLMDTGDSEETGTESSENGTLIAGPSFRFTNKHKLLTFRLSPLRQVQAALEAQIGAGASKVDDLSLSNRFVDPAPFVEVEPLAVRSSNVRRPKEFSIRSDCGWKETLRRLRSQLSLDHPKHTSKGSQAAGLLEAVVGCGQDIASLWTDDVVQAILRSRDMRLEELSGLLVVLI
jgi:guanine nucleotide-binding protein alpha-1 subunit